MSLHIRNGENEPGRDVILREIEILHEIAQEKQVTWEPTWDDEILHGAGYSTDAEIAASQEALQACLADHPDML